jgi:hypothetical protein
VALSLGGAGAALAQTQSVPVAAVETQQIVGTVQDARGLPLLGAFVAAIALGADQPEAIVVTDARGQFQIPNLNEGIYTLLVGSLGFAGTVLQGVAVPAAAPVSLQLEADTDRALATLDAPLDLNWALRSGKRDVLRDREGTLVVDDGGQPAPTSTSWNRADRVTGTRPVNGELQLWSFTKTGDRETLGVTTLSLTDDQNWNLKAHLGDQASVWAAGDMSQRLSNAHELQVGFGYVGGSFDFLRTLDEEHDSWIGRVEAHDSWQVARSLSFEYGARYEHHNYLARSSLVSPSFRVAYDAGEHTRLFAGVSSESNGLDLTREEGSFEIVSLLGHASLRLSDTSTVVPERRNRYEVGVEQDVAGAQVRIRAYFDDVTDELLGVYVADELGINNYLLFNIGDSTARGMQLALAGNLVDGVSGEISYAFHDRSEDYPLRHPSTDLLPGEFEEWRGSQIHEVQATVAAEFRPLRTHLQASYNYRIGMPVVVDGQLDAEFGRIDVGLRQMLPFRALDTEWSAMVQIRNLLGPDYEGIYNVSLAELLGLTRGIAGGLAVRF